jgi:hypothetical protein
MNAPGMEITYETGKEVNVITNYNFRHGYFRVGKK